MAINLPGNHKSNNVYDINTIEVQIENLNNSKLLEFYDAHKEIFKRYLEAKKGFNIHFPNLDEESSIKSSFIAYLRIFSENRGSDFSELYMLLESTDLFMMNENDLKKPIIIVDGVRTDISDLMNSSQKGGLAII